LDAVFALLLLFVAIMHVLGYSPIYRTVFMLLMGLAVAVLLFSLVFWFSCMVKDEKQRRRSRVIASALCLILLIVYILGSLAFASLGEPAPMRYFHSPDNKHRVVVFEDAWIDAFYTAYPVVFGSFYQRQHCVGITRMDSRACDTEITWLPDGNARVYIIYDRDIGRVEEDSIPVQFD
jgi:MFS family permease